MHSGPSSLSTDKKEKPRTSSHDNSNEVGKSMAKFMKQKKKFTTIEDALINDEDDNKSYNKQLKLNLQPKFVP
jgi:hypothetical protein